MTKEFTNDEIIALKELAQEHIRFNEINHGEKTNPKPNVFPPGYTGPRSFAEAMSMDWNHHKKEGNKRE